MKLKNSIKNLRELFLTKDRKQYLSEFDIKSSYVDVTQFDRVYYALNDRIEKIKDNIRDRYYSIDPKKRIIISGVKTNPDINDEYEKYLYNNCNSYIIKFDNVTIEINIIKDIYFCQLNLENIIKVNEHNTNNIKLTINYIKPIYCFLDNFSFQKEIEELINCISQVVENFLNKKVDIDIQNKEIGDDKERNKYKNLLNIERNKIVVNGTDLSNVKIGGYSGFKQ